MLRLTKYIVGDLKLAAKARLIARPMPAVEPTNRAVGEGGREDRMSALEALTAVRATIVVVCVDVDSNEP